MTRVLAAAGIRVVLPAVQPAQPSPRCDQWNTETFFRVATADGVTTCIEPARTWRRATTALNREARCRC